MSLSNLSDEEFKELKEKVWAKSTYVDKESNDAGFRKDDCGAWIKWSDYGQDGEFGWEIDHINPASKNGSDDIENLRPLHHSNNESKGDSDRDSYPAKVTSVYGKRKNKKLGDDGNYTEM